MIENPERPWKKAAFSQFHRRPKVSADGGRYMGYSINTEDSHYIEWYQWDHKTGTKGEFVTAELYDRKNDPTETMNIANDEMQKDRVKKLSEQLKGGWKKAIP